MTDTLHYEIVSPECLLKDAHAAMIVVPGTDGDFTALPHHAPMMSTIRPGVVEIYEAEGAEPTRLFLKGGLAQINPAGLTILAEETIELDKVDTDDLNQKISNTKEDIEDAKDDIERSALEKKLAWMVALSEVVHAA
ncbi:F0F1 ATP synthase subunit epsilon [Kordiimonas marina]|uniref:F0F1 ATP synthase subunit epsilon n=1 Tax=Kordiimonas marina TaxID=2872312 RepID=UPI001FF46C1A|nr:F0F1 ATP synthase subunit epsilon [Kordiimonas marina]MCJ9427885.1 F0F1 ATP synthase subunit epsilon [Kordiimonas marina]